VWHTLHAEYTVFVQGASGDGLPQVVARVAAGLAQERLRDMTPLKRVIVEEQVSHWLVWLRMICGGNNLRRGFRQAKAIMRRVWLASLFDFCGRALFDATVTL
jgi:hypothetical protein